MKNGGPMTGNGKALLLPDEAAALIGKTRRTVYRMIRAGKLPSVLRAGGLRVPREALVKFMEEGDDENK